MSPLTLTYLALAFSAAAVVLLVLVLLRLGALRSAASAAVEERLRQHEASLRGLREEVALTRSDVRGEQGQMRVEVNATLGTFRAETTGTLADVRRELQDRGAASEQRIDQLVREVRQQLDALRTQVTERLDVMRTDATRATAQVTEAVDRLTTSNEQRMDGLRTAVEGRLEAIRGDNTRQLEEMRATVNEKLQATLEQRLGESFRSVSEQLERVHRGLGDMQTLATGVGDLKRVLSNVKVRGNWGEIQLGALLEQIMTPEQYALNVAVRPDSGERVEFAIRLPGRGEDGDAPVWLPIDAKFPQEDYDRLMQAHDAADVFAMETASKALESRIRASARDIALKYIHPPHTTDIGIMFLPTEGLYAEVARRPGLLEALQREHRVLVAGPSTLAALLNSLQMGFRTLAIQKRSSEVWTVLGAVKTEFGKFENVLAKVQKKLNEAGNTIEAAKTRTRVMGRKLKEVEAVPAAGSAAMIEAEIVDANLDLLPAPRVAKQLDALDEPPPEKGLRAI